MPEGNASGASDEELVRRTLAGDTEQFGHLVERYQEWLFQYALGMVLDRDSATDMVQDAFVRAYANLERCRNPSRFRYWLFRALRNRCLDYAKERRRRDVPLDAVGPRPASDESPSDGALRSDLRDRIARALEALTAEQREAFLLHHVEDLPYDVMAELLGASVSALKMRVLRARELLRENLAGEVTR